MSIGFNIVQYEEIQILRQEKAMYRIFFEYLYHKLETIEKEKSDKNLVYKNTGA